MSLMLGITIANVVYNCSLCHRTPNAVRSDGVRNPIGRRTESDRTAYGIQSGGGRNPIGRRTESDRTADGIRSDGGRNPMTKHDVSECESVY